MPVLDLFLVLSTAVVWGTWSALLSADLSVFNHTWKHLQPSYQYRISWCKDTWTWFYIYEANHSGKLLKIQARVRVLLAPILPTIFLCGWWWWVPFSQNWFYEAGFEVQLSCLNALHHDVNHFEYKHSVKNIFSSTLSESVLVWVRDMNWFSWLSRCSVLFGYTTFRSLSWEVPLQLTLTPFLNLCIHVTFHILIRSSFDNQ